MIIINIIAGFNPESIQAGTKKGRRCGLFYTVVTSVSVTQCQLEVFTGNGLVTFLQPDFTHLSMESR